MATGTVDIGAIERYYGVIAGVRFVTMTATGYWIRAETLAGLKVYIDLDHDFVADLNEPFDVTGEHGTYQINGLEPGTNTVVQELISGWKGTFVNYGMEIIDVSLGRRTLQAAGNDSDEPALSADGRIVVFRSLATNLVPGDTNGSPDIFAYDRQSAILTRVNTSQDGAQADW